MCEKRAIDILEEWLDGYLNFERLPQKNLFWLNTIQFLCDRFNNPQDTFKSIHIAGSKGKGSVSTMISSILDEYGKTCGLYTSPHILDLSERIGYAHGPFTEEIYEKALQEMMPRIDSIIPDQLPNKREITWFELITLYCFLCFNKAGIEWGVFETGMGGRLDATNVLMPKICVLTPIELEHTEYLGDTITKIAGEKAGIIKQRVPVCVSYQTKEAMNVITTKALETESPIYLLEKEIRSLEYSIPQLNNLPKPIQENQDFSIHKALKMKVHIDFKRFFSRAIDTELSLIGKVQADNAALSALTVKILYPEIDESIIEKGLAKAILPGRFEVTKNPYNTNIPVILDGAHTVNSLRGTLNTFISVFYSNKSQLKKPLLLFACAADKKVHELVHLLLTANTTKETESSIFSKITLTRPGCHKQSDLVTLENEFIKQYKQGSTSFYITPDYIEAIKNNLLEASEKQIPLLVTGSFYLVSEVKKLIKLLSEVN